MKVLTVKILREALGDYPVVQYLTDGRPDDYVLSDNLIDRNNYVACKLWHGIDISNVLQELGYKGTENEVKTVLNKSRRKIAQLEECTETDWAIIEAACEEVGFKRKS